MFKRGSTTSSLVQIDHVVALADSWQKGAQQLTPARREALANDPLNLLAVDGTLNQQKSAYDAATWLPPNKRYRCQYVARQVAVKAKYNLWITSAEKTAIAKILTSCPHPAGPGRLILRDGVRPGLARSVSYLWRRLMVGLRSATGVAAAGEPDVHG